MLQIMLLVIQDYSPRKNLWEDVMWIKYNYYDKRRKYLNFELITDNDPFYIDYSLMFFYNILNYNDKSNF
jgi:hypothetical protein